MTISEEALCLYVPTDDMAMELQGFDAGSEPRARLCHCHSLHLEFTHVSLDSLMIVLRPATESITCSVLYVCLHPSRQVIHAVIR